MAAPINDDWDLNTTLPDSGFLDPEANGGVPAPATQLAIRWAPHGTLLWSGPAFIAGDGDPHAVATAGPGNWDVQAAFAAGGVLLSGWSPTVTVAD